MNDILRTARRLAHFEKTPPRRAGIAAALSGLRLRAPADTPAASGKTARTAAARIAASVAAASFGAVLMYVFDPDHGRRRRALVRDQLAHGGHAFAHVRRRIARRGRFLRGVAKGVSHDTGHVASHVVRHDGHSLLVDNETLVARVRSEVLGDDRLKAGEIHVDAYEGCVTLRGQLDDVEQIRRVIHATRQVEGVTEVRSYLHLPGEIPPNKAEAYRHALANMPAM